MDDAVLELADGGGGAGAGAGGGDGAKKSPTIVLPTVIIDAATIPAGTGTDPDNAAHPSSATANSNNSHCIGNTSNISSSSSNISNHNNMSPHENNHDSSQSEGMLEEGRVVTVRDLLKGLYEKACQQKLWGLVRHTAGMLGKRVEDLAKAVTDLLVRQKQVTVGMPPNNEHTITAPLPEVELRQLIHDVSNPIWYGIYPLTCVLTVQSGLW